MLNFSSKFPQTHNDDLTFVTVSKKWNSVMQLNLTNCEKLKIPFLWIKHIEVHSDNIELDFSKNSDYFSILECKSSATYLEKFFFKAIEFLDYESWFLRIDSDELLSQKSLSAIKGSISELNSKYVYRIKRLWIKKLDDCFFYSNNAKSTQEKSDFQYRLFYSRNVLLDSKIHSPGIVIKKFKNLDQDLAIIHLIWIIENLNERIEKIKSYEEILSNAGISKLRYYLPEIFPEAIHDWTLLNPDDQLIVNEWFMLDSKNRFD